MEQKRMQKNSKGITLIALVITIIILLILAGVTIATLTGDNGILTQAGKAKDKTTEAESIERVQVEVAGSYGIDGTIDKEQLNKNLKNINGLIYNRKALSDSNKIANLPATVTLNGYDIGIDANGGVIEPAIYESVKQGMSQYTAEELIAKRSEVSNVIVTLLTDKLESRGIAITALNITDFSFSQEFDDAIEKKQVTEQQTQQAKYELEKAKVENEKKIENAKTEAEGMKQQNEQIIRRF